MPDTVQFDYAKLPDGNGILVLDKATANGARGLIITGYAFTLPPQELQKHEVLLKPIRPAEIVAAVDYALRAGRQE